MRIGVIGTGIIAMAVVRGLAEDGHSFVVSRRSAANSAALASECANVQVAENRQVLDESDVILLGLMAETARMVLPGLTFRPDHQIVSLMAGIPLSEIARLVAPAPAAALMIPFPSIADGGSPILAQGDTGLIRTLFGMRNRIIEPDGDAELAAYLCAQAVLSPVVQMVADAAGWLGARVSQTDQGEAFLRHLIASNLRNSDSAAPGDDEQAGISQALAAGLDALEGKR